MSKPTVISNLQEFKDATGGDTYAVVDFWATCNEKLAFYKVDVDDAVDVAQEAGIRAMPTFILYKGGVAIQTLTGANPSGLQSLIAKAT